MTIQAMTLGYAHMCKHCKVKEALAGCWRGEYVEEKHHAASQ